MKIQLNAGVIVPFLGSRKYLVRDLKSYGNTLFVTGYDNPGINDEKCRKLDIGSYHLKASRRGLNPVSDLMLIKQYREIMKKEKPDLVHSYTAKPNIYGSIAAGTLGIKHVFPVINGLGYVFTDDDYRTKVIRFFVCILYKYAFKYAEKVFFQNRDDAEELINRHVIERDKCVIISGTGISLQEYPYQKAVDHTTFFMATRLFVSKGVGEYLKAAEIVKGKYPESRFLLAGAIDNTRQGFSKILLEDYISKGIVDYLGYINNMPEVLAKTTIFVLPSYYREGIPRVILQAMSSGCAILTTNSIGCRETILEPDAKGKGKNGYMIAPKDINSLADKMIWMIEHPEETEKMGIESRKYAEKRFDVEKINRIILRTMGIEK